MATLTSLANETLHMVFANINSAKHLAQCRLVCKRFNAMAEMAMFNCPITVNNTESQALCLLQHLAKHQRVGIEHFHWELRPTTSSTTPQVLKHLLPVILTSNTVSLTGVIQEQEYYELIDEIVEQLDEPNEQYYHLLAKYRNSLQSAYVYLDNEEDIYSEHIQDIRNFPALKTLVIKTNYLLFMSGILGILSNQLEELELDVLTIDGLWTNREEMYQWIAAHVEQSNSMKKLTVKEDCPACCMESLTYMYPKIESVSIGINELQQSNYYYGLDDYMDGIMDCLSTLPLKELVFTFVNGFHFKELVVYFKNHGYEVRIPAQQTGSDIRMMVVVASNN